MSRSTRQSLVTEGGCEWRSQGCCGVCVCEHGVQGWGCGSLQTAWHLRGLDVIPLCADHMSQSVRCWLSSPCRNRLHPSTWKTQTNRAWNAVPHSTSDPPPFLFPQCSHLTESASQWCASWTFSSVPRTQVRASSSPAWSRPSGDDDRRGVRPAVFPHRQHRFVHPHGVSLWGRGVRPGIRHARVSGLASDMQTRPWTTCECTLASSLLQAPSCKLSCA